MTSYEVITNKIIEKLNEGKIPWVKPWRAAFSCSDMNSLFPAYSYSNGKRYAFINQMLLDFEAGEFATYQQIKKAGGKVKKGEKAHVVCGWIVDTKGMTDANGDPILDDDGNQETRTTYALRYYNVFNILTQVEGIEPKHDWTKAEADEQPDDAPKHEPVEAAENIITRYINSADAPKLEIKASDRAYYSPALDLVVVPLMEQYDRVEEYYSTTFHELTHSTLKESRCNRKQSNKNAAFGSKEYSKEELVAEIGSCFLSNTAGLSSDSAFRNSCGYIQGWLKALKDDPKMIVQASAQAEKATEYILNAK